MKKLFEKGHKTNVTHGESVGRTSPEYQCWLDIKGRCLNPKHASYKDYGGRGITICEKWRDNFPAFLADVGRRPTDKHTIDRHPDNNGNYEPNNVRWATRAQQVANRRNSRLVSINGEKITLRKACERNGKSFKLVTSRLSYHAYPVATLKR